MTGTGGTSSRCWGKVGRSGWELISFVLLSNHFHLLVRTPRADLARGMQRLLSAHAVYFAARHRRPGQVFQGRDKAVLIEDKSFYWTVSRYIHLNPVRAGLVEAPEAYRRYVAAGLESPPESPFASLRHGWVLGSAAFVTRLRGRLPSAPTPRETREARAVERARPELSWAEVVGEVCPLRPRAGGPGPPGRSRPSPRRRRVAGPSLHPGAAPGAVGGWATAGRRASRGSSGGWRTGSRGTRDSPGTWRRFRGGCRRWDRG